MPAAIPFIIQAVGTYLGANAIVLAVVVLAASAAISNYQKRKAARSARDAYNASLEDRLVMTATANTARSKVYGRVRNVDGIVFKGTWGPNSEKYVLVVAMAAHEIDAFETIYFNELPSTLMSDGVPVAGGVDGGVGYYVTSLPYGKIEVQTFTTSATLDGSGNASIPLGNPGVVGSGSYYWKDSDAVAYNGTMVISGSTGTITGGPNGVLVQITYQAQVTVPKARIWKYKGGAGQTLVPLLGSRFPTLLTANDKFSGMAIVVVELTYDQDVFPTGVPSVTAIMRGAKVLDTRTGITAWTENPAMIARDWALYANGGNMTTTDLDEPSFIAAANACDVSTVFNTTVGNETRPLYQCGIVCKTDINPDDHFGEMIEAMAGQWGFKGGQMKVTAGVYRAPVAAITDIWLNNNTSVIVTKDPSKQDLVNNYKPLISNADGYNGTDASATTVAYTSTPMPPLRSLAFIAADGQELTQEVSLLGVTRNVHAQHICGVKMRYLRDALTVQLTCNMRAWPLELFDVVTLTLPVFGFAAKEFEVIAWKYTIDEGVQLQLKETAASIYAVGSGIEVLDASINTTLPLPWFVEQITGLAVTSGTVALEDGWPTTRILVTWNAVVSDSVRQSGQIEVQYAEMTGVAGAPVVWQKWIEPGNSTEAIITGLKSGAAYVFRARAVNTLGVAGAWSVQSGHIVVDPPLVDTPIIEPEAATVALSAYSDSGTYTASGSPSYSPDVCVINWTNDTGEVATLQCEWSCEIVGGAGSALKNVFALFEFVSSNPALVSNPLSTATDLNSLTVNRLIQRNVNPGSTVKVNFRFFSASASYPISWTKAYTRLTVIKR